MSADEPFEIKQTNVNQPQVQSVSSKQSLSASEDYYSVSEPASSGGSDSRSQRTVIPYTTPPSRNPTALSSHDQLRSRTTLPLSPIEDRSSTPRFPSPPNSEVENLYADDRSITPEVFPSPPVIAPVKAQNMEGERSPPTPGVDDTPYIRFAIEQLTRDEEVRGSRQYTTVNRSQNYLSERVVSGERLRSVTPEQRQSYVSRLEERPREEPFREDPFREEQVHQEQFQVQPEERSYSRRDIFEPYDPPKDSLQYPPLKFLPRILRPFWLGLFILLCILILAALIYAGARSALEDGLWDYESFSDDRYFIFRYLPTIVGMFVLLWLFQIQIATQRVVPFMAMASSSHKFRWEGIFLNLYPNQFIFPNLEYFRAGKPILGVCFLFFWFFMLTIPLLASAFSVRFYFDIFGGQWRWVAVEGVIWSLVALYFVLIIALLALGLTLWRNDTGLRWDPRSLADIIALLERSNIMKDYMGTETCVSKKELRWKLPNRIDRLGYWHTSRRANDVFYGIGEEGAMPRAYSIEQGRIREKGRRSDMHVGGDFDLEQQEFRHSFRYDLRAPEVRFRYVPWFLKDTFVIAWIVSAFVLFIAFLVVSFVRSAVENGFDPQVNAGSTSDGFSTSNFIYSFFPALIGLILFVLIQSMDLVFRRLQPYVELSKIGGSTADKTLLVDYSARLPLSASAVAASNSHFRVAILSLIPILTLPIPIIAGGVFWTQFYSTDLSIRVSAEMPAFYALCVFLGLYAVLLCLSYPPRTHRLPHDSRCLAQLVSWLYMSRLLSDPSFHRVEGKADLVARLITGARSANSLQAHHMASIDATAANGTSGMRASAATRYNKELPPDPTSIAGPSRSTPPPQSSWARTTFTNTIARFPAAMLSAERLSLGRRKDRAGSTNTNGTTPFHLPTQNHPATPGSNINANTYPSYPLAEGDIKYGFGIFVGRDGREHVGIDRVKRVGTKMTFFEDSRRGGRARREKRSKMEQEERESYGVSEGHGAKRGWGLKWRRRKNDSDDVFGRDRFWNENGDAEASGGRSWWWKRRN